MEICGGLVFVVIVVLFALKRSVEMRAMIEAEEKVDYAIAEHLRQLQGGG